MPLYTVSATESISAQDKQQLAQLIVDLHCAYTGAPETFVNVIYWEKFPLKAGINYHILATVRKGRSQALNDELYADMRAQTCKLLRISEQQIELNLLEVPAVWVMEGGHVLPDPGQEDQCDWLHQAQ